MRVNASTPEGRLRKFCVLKARENNKSVDWVRGIAAEMFGVPSMRGLCLTTLTKVELILLADRIVTLTGGTPGAHRPGPRHSGANGQRLTANGSHVTQLASLKQHQLIRVLQEELRMNEDELRGVSRKACGKAWPRTMGEAVKVLQALVAIRRRRQIAAAQEDERASANTSVRQYGRTVVQSNAPGAPHVA